MAELLVGRNPVREVLRARRRRVEEVLLARGVQEKGIIAQIVQLCRERGIPLRRVERQQLDQRAKEKHQGVAALVSFYPYVDLAAILALAQERGELPFLLALDSLQDPQNFGSLLRTAEAVGVHGVILPTRRSVQVTPAVVRASAGAVEHLLIARVTNLARTLAGLKRQGIWVVGIEDHPQAQDYRQVELDLAAVFVLGSEGQGMRRLVAEQCDWLLRIPMRGRINSLNVAVAGSIVLYRAFEAREEG